MLLCKLSYIITYFTLFRVYILHLITQENISGYLIRRLYWMSGSGVLSEEEKQEMLQDAKDLRRKDSFLAARLKSQQGTIDEYIDFLSQNMEWIEFTPSRRVTTHFKL